MKSMTAGVAQHMGPAAGLARPGVDGGAVADAGAGHEDRQDQDRATDDEGRPLTDAVSQDTADRGRAHRSRDRGRHEDPDALGPFASPAVHGREQNRGRR